MKYLVFYSCDIYPKGGVKDIIGEADSVEEAENIISQTMISNDDPEGFLSWYQIVDRENLQIIKSSDDE